MVWRCPCPLGFVREGPVQDLAVELAFLVLVKVFLAVGGKAKGLDGFLRRRNPARRMIPVQGNARWTFPLRRREFRTSMHPRLMEVVPKLGAQLLSAKKAHRN